MMLLFFNRKSGLGSDQLHQAEILHQLVDLRPCMELRSDYLIGWLRELELKAAAFLPASTLHIAARIVGGSFRARKR